MRKFLFSILLLTVVFTASFVYSSAGDEPAGTPKAPALIRAIYAGKIRLVAYYIRRGQSVNMTHVGLPALHHAVTTGNLRIISYLVRKGAKVNKKDQHGKTALSLAKQIGNKRVIRYLRRVGAR